MNIPARKLVSTPQGNDGNIGRRREGLEFAAKKFSEVPFDSIANHGTSDFSCNRHSQSRRANRATKSKNQKM